VHVPRADRRTRGRAVFGAAWAAGWAFTIAFTLYAYYEDGPVAVAVFVAVRLLPAALVAPLARRLGGRIRFAYTLGARATLLTAVALAVDADLVAFPIVLALVALYRIAGAADRWYFAALDPSFDGTPAAMRKADGSRRDLEEASLLAGALAAGLGMLAFPLHSVFALCALAYAATAAAAAIRRPLRAPAPAGPLLTLRSPEPRRLHLLRGGRAAARAAIELIVVILALDLLGMEDSGIGWLTAALAIGLLAGARILPPAPVPRPLATASVLAGVPLALLALKPPAAVALALVAAVGVGFALCRRAERTLEDRCDPGAHIEGEEVVDALARIAGATLAAALILELDDTAAVVAAGALVALLGVAVLSLLEPASAAPLPEPAAAASPEPATPLV
jgi:hypothetical protein